MPEPTQTTIYGTAEPLRAPQAPPVRHEQAHLFTAPPTIRGQLAIEHSEEQEAR